MIIVAFEIIINLVFGIVIVVVVNCESPTLNPLINIIIVDDEAKDPIILRRVSVVVVGIIINVVFGIVIAVIVVIVIVDYEGPPLSSLTLSPVVRIIIVGDEAKDPIIGGGRGS